MRHILVPLFFAPVLVACAFAQSATNERTPRTDDVRHVTDPAPDACRASQFRYLVGKKRSEMPAKPDGANWRIACTTCAVTLDFSPTRMNVFFNEKTDVIEEVKCG